MCEIKWDIQQNLSHIAKKKWQLNFNCGNYVQLCCKLYFSPCVQSPDLLLYNLLTSRIFHLKKTCALKRGRHTE